MMSPLHCHLDPHAHLQPERGIITCRDNKSINLLILTARCLQTQTLSFPLKKNIAAKTS